MKLEKFLRNIASGLTLGLMIIIQGCEKPGMFTEMSPDETGIVFSNDITEDGHNNIMTYEYTYNGAGVAVGDLNNDGLTDIYFIGNQVPNKLFLNLGDWKFEEVTLQAGLQGRNDWNTGGKPGRYKWRWLVGYLRFLFWKCPF